MRLFIFSLAVILAANTTAQDQLGIAPSNYAGSDVMGLDPARGVLQWQYLDVNLIGVSLNVWNNFIFLPGDRYRLLGEVRSGINGTSGEITVDANLREARKKAFVAAKVHAPAALLSLGRGAIGIHITSRAYLNAVGMEPHLGRFIFHGLNYAPQMRTRYRDEDLRLSSAAWTELAANYSHIVKSTANDLVSVGITGKYLMGHFGSALQFDVLDYEVLDSNRLAVYEVSGSYGMVAPSANAGKGWGMDFGFHYQRTLEDAERYIPHRATGCEPMEYRYRFSVGLLDLGGIRFRNAFSGELDQSAGDISNYTDVGIEGQEGVDSLISATVDQFTAKSDFKVGIPTAATLQYDHRIAKHLYASATVVHPLASRSSLRLRRSSLISIAPRYETKRFEVALPIVMREFSKPTVGLMLRLNSIIIGSDHLMPFISRRDIYGADLYFRVKLTLFRSPHCKGKKAKRRNSNGDAALPCVIPR